MLVQLFVFAQGQGFPGPAIEAATQRQQLIPGEMDIYHRRSLDGTSPTARFSMANLVKPGTFPFEAMGGFSTPGLALFAQFDGRPSDLMVYDELVQTARALADELGGEVATKDRRPFDDRVWERLRSRLLRLIDARADALAGTTRPVNGNDADASGDQLAVETRDDAVSAADDPAPPDRR
jgi:cell division protein ZipA